MEFFGFGKSRFQMFQIDPAVIGVGPLRIVESLQRQMLDRPAENLPVVALPRGLFGEDDRAVRAPVEAVVRRQRMRDQMPVLSQVFGGVPSTSTVAPSFAASTSGLLVTIMVGPPEKNDFKNRTLNPCLLNAVLCLRE